MRRSSSCESSLTLVCVLRPHWMMMRRGLSCGSSVTLVCVCVCVHE